MHMNVIEFVVRWNPQFIVQCSTFFADWFFRFYGSGWLPDMLWKYFSVKHVPNSSKNTEYFKNYSIHIYAHARMVTYFTN